MSATPEIAAPADPSPIATCLFIVGMHRSGTSLTAGLFGEAWGGLPRDLLPASEDNVQGHFESRRLTVFNENLLRACGSAWDDAAPLDVARALGPEAHHGWCRRAGELLLEALDGRDRLVFKDPRLCRLMPFWRAAAQERGVTAKAVLPLRHPDEVAASLEARDGLTRAYTHRLWLRNVLDAEAGTRGLPRASVAFDAILDDWPALRRDLLERLGLDADGVSTGDHLIRASLRHHRVGSAGERAMPPAVASVFTALLDAAPSGEPMPSETLQAGLHWLDGDGLSWGLLRDEITARRAILEASTESLDALVQRMEDEREALGEDATAEPDDERPALAAPRPPFPERDADRGSLAAIAHLRLREAALSQARALRTIADMRASSSWQLTKPMRFAGYAAQHYLLRPLRTLRNRVLSRTHRAIARPTPEYADVARYFDAGWYRHSGPRLPIQLHPVDHYVQGGHAEGREPAAWFDSERYRARAGLGADDAPFVHFVRHGAALELFDPTDEQLAVAADILLRSGLPAGWRVAGISDFSIRDGTFYSTGPDPQIVMEPDRPLSAGVYIVNWAYSGARGLAP
ncbi:MAG: hypothetical protein AAF321_03325, partial [Pseudomonadota bacterium]